MKEITVTELKTKIDSNEPHQLIDVREPYEIEICEIGGEAIPMGEIMQNLDRINKDVPVIIHCRSGKRSAAIVNALEANGFNDCYNLVGGILAWANEIDNTLEQY